MSGSRVLLAIVDGGGTVPPALGLARELLARGHAVRVLGDPTIGPSAAAAGCAFTPWTRAPHLDTVADQTAMIAAVESGNPYRRLRAIGHLLGAEATRGFADDVLAAVRQDRPDAVLVEAAVPGILLGAEAADLPYAALMPNIYLRPTRGLPLFGTGWSPASGVPGRTRDAVVPALVRLLLSAGARPLNRVRAQYGLAPVADPLEVLDRCTRVLVLTSPTFDLPTPHLPANVRYVGPQLDDPSWASTGDWRPDGADPLVLVALSSVYQDQLDTLRRVVIALGSLPVRAVVTTGRAVGPERLPRRGNVVAVASAPHREVMAEAAVVLTHAGHGTTLKALAAGVPLVCLPMGRDQRDNTTRVVRLGAGVRVPHRAPPARIAAAVERVLGEPAFSAAAGAVADRLAEEAATRPRAVDEVEAMLARHARGA